MHAPQITRTRVTLAAAGAALLISLLPAPPLAADKEATKKEKDKMPSYPALMEMNPMDVMHMMDPQNKGYVTHDEFMKFYEALFQRLDRDNNQKITAPEFTDRG